MYLRNLSGSIYKHSYVSQTPLQDPCLRIRISASICISGASAKSMSPEPCLSVHMYLRNLCKIHVSGSVNKHPYVSQDPLQDPCLRFMSQYLYISGSSARSMSSDSCLSIFLSQGKIHVSGSVYKHPYVSQDPLQDPCLRIHVSASTNMDPLQDPRLWAHVSASWYLRLLCKIHVSASVYKHPYVSQEPLQVPCLRNHVSASIYISGTSARSMSPDPYISIHMYLRLLCKIHVSRSVHKHP